MYVHIVCFLFFFSNHISYCLCQIVSIFYFLGFIIYLFLFVVIVALVNVNFQMYPWSHVARFSLKPAIKIKKYPTFIFVFLVLDVEYFLFLALFLLTHFFVCHFFLSLSKSKNNNNNNKKARLSQDAGSTNCPAFVFLFLNTITATITLLLVAVVIDCNYWSLSTMINSSKCIFLWQYVLLLKIQKNHCPWENWKNI